MARYIDADALFPGKILAVNTKNPMETVEDLMNRINNAPTIEARPVVRGEWLLRHEGHGHYWECSACHTNPCIYVTKDTNFCPNCGAEMRGDEDGEA